MQPKLLSYIFLLICLGSFLPHTFAQKDLPTDYLSPEFHKNRREAARSLMPDHSIMVVFSAPTRTFSNDVDYFYHQNPDLYYFTGYKEPNSFLIIFKDPQTGKEGQTYNELFFVQSRNPQRELWTGRRLGTAGVKEQLKINTVFTGDEFKNFPIDFSSYSKVIMSAYPLGITDNQRDSADLYDLVEQFKSRSGILDPSKDEKASTVMFREITGKLREIKTPEELLMIRKAVEISCIGHNEVMKTINSQMSELEIQGLHEYIHKKYGAEEVGYGSIIGAGDNGCILHYEENTRKHVGQNLVLMDVGAEYHGYSADVTRTVPATGKFSSEERQIYQLVFDAQEAAFRLLKDGAKWADAGTAARDIIANGLISLGIIKTKEEVRKYYPHGLSHHIGLDVHDRAFSPNLKKGMVITIEPGIYIPENSSCDKKWWGIGVRIEDDVLVKENGYEILSAYAPRSIADVEKMVSQHSLLDNYKLPPLQTEKKSF